MRTPFIVLKYIGKAALNYVGAGVLGDVLVDVAEDVMEKWAKETDEEERQEELEAVAQATAEEVRDGIARIVEEIAEEQSDDIRQAVSTYLTQVPAMIRCTLRRPSDMSGTTVPRGMTLRTAEDLLPFLPAEMPRFKPGDCPLPGVDLELVELLGVGGFGEVWKARNPHFMGVPPVALKFCLDPQATDQLLCHEAALLSRVMEHSRHPGIVALRNTYLRADPPCLEYEYVNGGDLGGLIKEWQRGKGGATPEESATIIRSLAETVGHFHRLDPPIVHRDLKPSNILVEQLGSGEPRFLIADFGIGGIAAGSQIRRTQWAASSKKILPSIVRGSHTPLYASPEQTRGCPPDPRDDVHALGVIWYQLLTGDLTRGVPGGRQWTRRLKDRGMTDQMLDLLASCFEERAEDRPADAAELAEELGTCLQELQETRVTPVKKTRVTPAKKTRVTPAKKTRVKSARHAPLLGRELRCRRSPAARPSAGLLGHAVPILP